MESSGVYTTDADDHKRIGDLPSDFPLLGIWKDFLTKFRADRNLADYDHTASENDLEMDSKQYLKKAVEFDQTARLYLKSRGAI
jgi:hypothetical protein